MVTDPRLVIRQLFDPAETDYAVTPGNLLLEDGTTRARHEATYEENPVELRRLLVTGIPAPLDLIFVVLYIGEESPDDYGGGPVCYNQVIGVQPVTIDKLNVGDASLKLDGDKLARAAKEEIRMVIRENPFGSIRNVRGTAENTERVGATLIWGDIVEVRYKEYASKS